LFVLKGTSVFIRTTFVERVGLHPGKFGERHSLFASEKQQAKTALKNVSVLVEDPSLFVKGTQPCDTDQNKRDRVATRFTLGKDAR
jgi:hypothetical protein